MVIMAMHYGHMVCKIYELNISKFEIMSLCLEKQKFENMYV